MKRRNFELVAATAAIVFASTLSVCGIDLMVADATTETISGTKTYGQIIVNGTLNVADGANITTTRLICGTNGTGVAVFNMGKASKMTITGTDGNGLDCCFGYDSACEATIDEGAVLSTKYAVGVYADTSTSTATAFLTLSNATFDVAETLFFSRTAKSYNDRTMWRAQIRLTGEDALLKVKCITRNQYGSARILFNGGQIQANGNRGTSPWFQNNQNGSNTRLMFEGENGNAVILDSGDYTLSGYFGNVNGENPKIGVQGDCDLILRGNVACGLSGAEYVNGVSLTHTGKTIVENAKLTLNRENLLSANSVVLVSAMSELDFCGYAQIVPAVNFCRGKVGSSSASAKLTLSSDTIDSVVGPHVSNVVIIKNGAADAVIRPGANLSGLRLNAGSVTARSYQQEGFEFYRFRPTEKYVGGTGAVQYNELYLFGETGSDITGMRKGYTYGVNPDETQNPEKALDGNPTTKYFVRLLEDAWLAVQFAGSRKLSGYTFATGDDFGPIHKYWGRTDKTEPPDYDKSTCRDVSGWVFEGSVDGMDWIPLHEVTGFTPEDTRNYVYPRFALPRALTLGNVYVEAGTKMTFDDVEVTVGSLGRRGIITSVHDATIVTGGDSDGCVAYPAINGGADLVKTGSGTTTILGGGSFAQIVDVRSGTLRFGEIGGVGPWFRFSITAARTNGNNKVQLSELALYDVRGSRVNSALVYNTKNKDVTTLTAGEVTVSEGNDPGNKEGADKMFDGDLMTKAFLAKPTVKVSMRLAEIAAATRVVSYAVATAGDHDERDPAGWKLETSPDGSAWTQIDERTLEAVTTERNSWAAYNNDIPYYAGNFESLGKTAFSSDVCVSVASGATLDLEGTTTEVGTLRVDSASAGTIKGGVVAENGILNIVGSLPRGSAVALPLVWQSVANPERLKGWTVSINDVIKPNYWVSCDNGFLSVHRPGAIMIVR